MSVLPAQSVYVYVNTLSPVHEGVAVSLMVGIISVPHISTIVGGVGIVMLNEQSTVVPSSGGRTIFGEQQV